MRLAAPPCPSSPPRRLGGAAITADLLSLLDLEVAASTSLVGSRLGRYVPFEAATDVMPLETTGEPAAVRAVRGGWSF